MEKMSRAKINDKIANIQNSVIKLFNDEGIDYFMCSFTVCGRTIEMSNCPEDKDIKASFVSDSKEQEGDIGENETVGFARG